MRSTQFSIAGNYFQTYPSCTGACSFVPWPSIAPIDRAARSCVKLLKFNGHENKIPMICEWKYCWFSTTKIAAACNYGVCVCFNSFTPWSKVSLGYKPNVEHFGCSSDFLSSRLGLLHLLPLYHLISWKKRGTYRENMSSHAPEASLLYDSGVTV